MNRGGGFYINPDDFAMSHEEIAQILGTTRQTVANVQTRAIRKLRKQPLAVGILVALAREVARARERKQRIEVRR